MGLFAILKNDNKENELNYEYYLFFMSSRLFPYLKIKIAQFCQLFHTDADNETRGAPALC